MNQKVVIYIILSVILQATKKNKTKKYADE
jgi:hypothetical protein